MCIERDADDLGDGEHDPLIGLCSCAVLLLIPRSMSAILYVFNLSWLVVFLAEEARCATSKADPSRDGRIQDDFCFLLFYFPLAVILSWRWFSLSISEELDAREDSMNAMSAWRRLTVLGFSGLVLYLANYYIKLHCVVLNWKV